MKRSKHSFLLPLTLLDAFVLWTWAVCAFDVQPIGPHGSEVGFAGLNGWFHRLTGVHASLYAATDLLSLVPLGLCAVFGLLGLVQWVRRKRLRRVDPGLLLLGGFYLTVAAAFLAFEIFPVNYRPVLIDGRLEASYPSSTTLLALCVMPTAAIQLRQRLKHGRLRRRALLLLRAVTVALVVGRLLSGVHWLTDILGGMLLSGGLVGLYAAADSRLRPGSSNIIHNRL